MTYMTNKTLMALVGGISPYDWFVVKLCLNDGGGRYSVVCEDNALALLAKERVS